MVGRADVQGSVLTSSRREKLCTSCAGPTCHSWANKAPRVRCRPILTEDLLEFTANPGPTGYGIPRRGCLFCVLSIGARKRG
jgi:hypothetical protein